MELLTAKPQHDMWDSWSNSFKLAAYSYGFAKASLLKVPILYDSNSLVMNVLFSGSFKKDNIIDQFWSCHVTFDVGILSRVAHFHQDNVSHSFAAKARDVSWSLQHLSGRSFFLEWSVGDMEDPLPQQHFLVDPAHPRLSYIGCLW